ncbi:MAG TPA: ribonuclease domain-containing protein [Thiobacillaceae bacterium]|nr:ribonuclease domain-containing protein [Thiobacillaceae bacterium]HNU65313.1 ribonuclease domain-containing protein [Thiobacillaceae bacterium]
MQAWRVLLLIVGLLLLASWLGWDVSRMTSSGTPIHVASPDPEGLVSDHGRVSHSSNEIHVSRLPPEGRHTLALIRQGGPYAHARDGTIFGNREGLLPGQARGYYREYTVPTPGVGNRGARRIVAGRDGDFWYSEDHYQSFTRIRE